MKYKLIHTYVQVFSSSLFPLVITAKLRTTDPGQPSIKIYSVFCRSHLGTINEGPLITILYSYVTARQQ